MRISFDSPLTAHARFIQAGFSLPVIVECSLIVIIECCNRLCLTLTEILDFDYNINLCTKLFVIAISSFYIYSHTYKML